MAEDNVIDFLKGRFDALDRRFDRLDAKLELLTADVTALQQDVAALQKDVTTRFDEQDAMGSLHQSGLVAFATRVRELERT